MIVRQIKIIKQSQHIFEALKEVDQEDLNSSMYQEQGKRTLNPEMPQIQHQGGVTKDFQCAPQSPFFAQLQQTQLQKPKLSYEMPLECPVIAEEKDQIQETRSQNIHNYLTVKKQHEPRYSINRKWRSNISKQGDSLNLRSNISHHNSRYTQQSEASLRPVQRYFRKIPTNTILDELQLSLKDSRPDEQENTALKSKTHRSVIRSRITETLHKFRNQREKQEIETRNAHPRYSKSLQADTTRTFNTQKNIINDHIKGKASALHSQTANKRTVPQDSESIDQQFSTIFGRTEQPKATDSQEQIVPISYFEPKIIDRERITISYKTTLFQLKQLCLRDNISQQQVILMIPEPLSVPIFDSNQGQDETFSKAKRLLNDLAISHTSINIKRYSNCVIVITGGIAIVNNFNGKVYIGGWSCSTKIGLGLEWQPNKYIYYGEFKNSKRNGVGVYKNIRGEVAAGMWKDNVFEGHLRKLSGSQYSKGNRSMRIDDEF